MSMTRKGQRLYSAHAQYSLLHAVQYTIKVSPALQTSPTIRMSTTEAQPPKYRLIYWPIRGRAELIRILLVHLEIPFEDVRIEISEWKKQQPDSPFGVVPILEFLDTGKKISSSITIARMFAEEHGLAGSNVIENTELFSIVDATADAWVKVYAAIFHEKDEARKAVLVKNLHEEYLPDAMTKFERYARANNAEEGWIFGDKFTYADIAIYLLFEYVVSNIPGSLERYPTLAKQQQSVKKFKNIARWLKERPETPL